MMKVKVCGITTLSDALLAIEMGAWALGFNFYPRSARAISPQEAASIIACLPHHIVTVGVFVNATQEEILAIKKETHLNTIQCHGDESISFCKTLPSPVIQAVRPRSENDLPSTTNMKGLYAVLIDAAVIHGYGGTGKQADWMLARKMASQYPTILAGGLNAENIIDAITKVNPFAVDVCSGVEETLGRKSKQKLANFFKAVHQLERGSL